MNEVKCPIKYLRHICTSFSMNCVLVSFVHFSIGFLPFLRLFLELFVYVCVLACVLTCAYACVDPVCMGSVLFL